MEGGCKTDALKKLYIHPLGAGRGLFSPRANWKVLILRANGGCRLAGVGGGLGLEGTLHPLDIYTIFPAAG